MNKITFTILTILIVAITVTSCKEKNHKENFPLTNTELLNDDCGDLQLEKQSTNPEIIKLKESMAAFRNHYLMI